jgi:hypothetical protein
MRTSAWDLQDVDLVSEAGLFPFLPPVSPTPSLPQHDWTSPSWVEDARDVRPRSPGMFPAQMPRSLPASPLPLSASPPAAAIAANTIAAASAAPPSSIALALPAHPAVWYPSPALAQATDGKKAKHRAIDAKRRNLETEAMQVLQKLVPGISATSGLRSSSVPVPKVALLRACADYIRQLQGLVHQHPDQSESDSTTSTRLAPDRKRQRLDPPEGSDHLARIEESHVLRNEMFVSAAVLLCCMDLTGRWLDVNERWLQRLCWSRDDVTGRFGSPIAAYMPFITQHPQAQMSFPSSELVRFHGGCSKGFEYVQHDAMTISQLRSLFQGLQKVGLMHCACYTCLGELACSDAHASLILALLCAYVGDHICRWLCDGLWQVHRDSLELLACRAQPTAPVFRPLRSGLGDHARQLHLQAGHVYGARSMRCCHERQRSAGDAELCTFCGLNLHQFLSSLHAIVTGRVTVFCGGWPELPLALPLLCPMLMLQHRTVRL